MPSSLRASVLATLVLTAPLAAQVPGTSPGPQPIRVEGLGSLSFPNSGSPEAQYPFLRGVLLLHSFEYDDAAEAFRRAQAIDPDFALAYWGEAMTHTHPVWNEKDTRAARTVLERYAPTSAQRAARAPTERERGYIEAIDVLYGDGPKARRDTLYAAAMGALSERHPDDLEAKAFHALALLGLSQGDRDVPRYMEAGAIALEVFAANPEHPGAAHYVIHAFDDPTHAILAMDAAVAYGAMAPDAAHAQHMTSHIFLARGMWDEVVEANVRADAVVDRGLAARGAPTTSCGHYNQWLSYGFQQEGRAGRASELVLACAAQAADEARSAGARASADFSAGVQRAWYLADTEQRGGPVARLRSTLADPGAAWSWGNGFVAARSGEIAEAQTQLAELRATVSAMDSTEFMAPYAPVWIGTLQAEIARANGDPDRALGVARAAADYEASLPVDFGPPLALKPAREVEAEVLLELERYAEAASAFDRQLQRTPRRVRSLLGSATAHLRAGNTAAGLAKFETLANVLDEADEGFGPALQARSALQGAAAGAAGAAAGAAGSRR